MVVIGERMVAGGNGGIFQTEKFRYRLNIEGYRPGDKFRIRAALNTCR